MSRNAYKPLPFTPCGAPFGPSVRSVAGAVLLRPLLTPAPRSKSLTAPLSPSSRTRRRPPEVSLTAFNAQPPDLRSAPLMDMDFAVTSPLVQRSRLSIRFFFIGSRLCLRASFRPRLSTTPLRFANPSPPSGWVGDSHPQAVKHARHTRRGGPCGRPPSGRSWSCRLNEVSGRHDRSACPRGAGGARPLPYGTGEHDGDGGQLPFFSSRWSSQRRDHFRKAP